MVMLTDVVDDVVVYDKAVVTDVVHAVAGDANVAVMRRLMLCAMFMLLLMLFMLMSLLLLVMRLPLMPLLLSLWRCGC